MASELPRAIISMVGQGLSRIEEGLCMQSTCWHGLHKRFSGWNDVGTTNID